MTPAFCGPFDREGILYNDYLYNSAGQVVGILGIGPRARQAARARQAVRFDGRMDRAILRQGNRTGSLASRLGLPAAIAPRGGPPALAETPYGLATVQAGSVAQGKLFPLGSTSIVAAAAGVFAGTLEVRAERSFRPTRLVLISSLSGQVTVSDISIGTARQVANLAVMPVEVFAQTTTSADIDFDVIEPGVLASVDLIFTATAASTAVVSGAYFGTEL